MISKDPPRNPKMLASFRLSELRTGNITLDLNKIINILKVVYYAHSGVFLTLVMTVWEDGRLFMS